MNEVGQLVNVPTRLSILAAARGGDDRAWSLLTSLYQPLINCWAMRYGFSQADAEDLSQEVMLRVVCRLSDFEHEGRLGSFRAWLRTIAANIAIDEWRRRARDVISEGRPLSPLIDQLAKPDNSLADQWDREHDIYIVRCILNLMELEFQPSTMMAFRKLVIEGRDAAAVAEEMHMNVGALYTAKSRVLKRMRELSQGWVSTSTRPSQF